MVFTDALYLQTKHLIERFKGKVSITTTIKREDDGDVAPTFTPMVTIDVLMPLSYSELTSIIAEIGHLHMLDLDKTNIIQEYYDEDELLRFEIHFKGM